MNPSEEDLDSLFSSLLDASNNARLYCSRGSIPDALYLLQDVKRTAEHLEQRLFEMDGGQRPSSMDESPQAGFPRYSNVVREESGRGLGSTIFTHSLKTSHTLSLPSYGGVHQPSFKSPASPAHGQGYSPPASLSASGSRPTSRSGSESGSSFQPLPPPPGAQGKSYQSPIKEVDEYGDPELHTRSHANSGTAASVTPVSQRYPLSAMEDRYSSSTITTPISLGRGYVSPDQGAQPSMITTSSPGRPLAGPTQPIFRQRHTSLPQVLNYQSSQQQPLSHEHPQQQHYYQHHQGSTAQTSHYGIQSPMKAQQRQQLNETGPQTNQSGYHHPDQRHHHRPHSPPTPSYSQQHPDFNIRHDRHHSRQEPHYHHNQQHHSRHPHIHYNRAEQLIDECPSHEQEQYHEQHSQQLSQQYHVTRQPSQPSYIPDQRARLPSLLKTDPHEEEYNDAADQQNLAPRRTSGGPSSSSSKNTHQQVPSTGSSSSSSRSGSRMIALGGLVSPSGGRGDNTGSRTQFHAPLEPEVVTKLDNIFFRFLQRICSDLNVCDSKGDHIHQPLMAKKMQRLEASTDFRPFKFRIQAFTNAFHDDLVQSGLTEDILPLRKVKLYLWKHRYISRFNEDGKKQKSKGNHVWNIEARKISNSALPPRVNANDVNGNSNNQDYNHSNSNHSNNNDRLERKIAPRAVTTTGMVKRQTSPARWEFREYSSRIAGQVIKFARVGIPYVYSPRIWDAQMSCPAAKFSSPWLPSWLKWHKGELKGIPSPEDESCMITVIAEYVREGDECRLEMSFPLTVSDPAKEGELMDSQNEHEDEDELDEEEYDDRERERERNMGGQMDVDPAVDREREQQSCHYENHRGQSQFQAQQHNQAQQKLQHLQLQENPKHHQQGRGGRGNEDDSITIDEAHGLLDEERDMDEDEEEGHDKSHTRKQSRERLPVRLAQESKRRKQG